MGDTHSELMDYVRSVAKKVDSVIHQSVHGAPRELYEAALHYVKAGGKRLRPAVVFLFGEGLGCSNADVLAYLGAAVEVLHTYTLIHDDIMDRDTVRRGVPTVHVLWGLNLAILAGDLLYAYVFNLISRAVSKGLKPERLQPVLDVVSWASIQLAEGQAMDMDFEKRDDVSVDEYIEMVKRKTAALFEACAAIGAIAAGANSDVVELARKVMRAAGIAFQIKDDILGITVATEKLGKPRYSDIREGKKTLPIIIALNRVDNEKRQYMLKVLRKELTSDSDIERVAKIIEDSGAIEDSERMARQYASEALKHLESMEFKLLDRKSMIRELIEFIVSRGY